MEVFKTFARFGDEVHLADTIRYKDAWWLVLTWLDDHDTKQEAPGKLVRMTGMSYQEIPVGSWYRFVLNDLLPKAFLDGETVSGYVVEDYLESSGSQP